MITGINHAGLIVQDLDKAIAFYRDVVSLEVKTRMERTGEAPSKLLGYDDIHFKGAHMTPGDGPTLELIQYINPPPSDRPTEERNVLGASHVAFTCEDMQGTFDLLMSRGAKELNPPQEVAPGQWRCYLQDPEGNWVELVENL